MATLRAVLLFPVRPATTADAIGRVRAAAAFALVPPLAISLYLVARGCTPADAAVTGLGILLLVLGIAVGGACAATAARRLVPGAPRRGFAVSLVFAAWAFLLFTLALVAGRLLGLGALAPLAGGFALLVWGTVTAARVVAGAGSVEPGRVFVAACGAVSGAMIGLLFTGYLVHAQLVMAMPAPVAIANGNPGDPLLVRRGDATNRGDIAVARDAASARVFLVRMEPNGRLVPLGIGKTAPSGEFNVLGRVFFRFGGPWGGSFLR